MGSNPLFLKGVRVTVDFQLEKRELFGRGGMEQSSGQIFNSGEVWNYSWKTNFKTTHNLFPNCLVCVVE